MDGGDLASIHSPAENNFVASLIQDRPVRGGEKVGVVVMMIIMTRIIIIIIRTPG